MKKMKTIGLKMTNYFKCFCLSACFISISVNHLSALPISAQHEKLSINMQDKRWKMYLHLLKITVIMYLSIMLPKSI